mgnify:CR=1 FL=1
MGQYINLTQTFFNENQGYVVDVNQLHAVRALNGMLVCDANTINDFPDLFEVEYNFLEVDLNYYNQYNVSPFVVIGKDKPSQFSYQLTMVERQFMARLWSWPTSLHNEIVKVYENSLVYMYERLSAGGYADIEHVLYKFLPRDLVTEIPVLGVEGCIAPNGIAIQN